MIALNCSLYLFFVQTMSVYVRLVHIPIEFHYLMTFLLYICTYSYILQFQMSQNEFVFILQPLFEFIIWRWVQFGLPCISFSPFFREFSLSSHKPKLMVFVTPKRAHRIECYLLCITMICIYYSILFANWIEVKYRD